MKNESNHPGCCLLCGEVVAKAAMIRHLQSCPERLKGDDTGGKKTPAFHLLVEGRDLPEYWLHVAIPVRLRLSHLDRFLRDIWLECCGHLSMFEIKGVEYAADFEETDDAKSPEISLHKVLGIGDEFRHEYDFGTTTRLSLRVLGAMEIPKKQIALLARNEPPFIPCEECGRDAELICGYCSHLDKGRLCSACARGHHCQEPQNFLPLINSPRTGLCGYTGPME